VDVESFKRRWLVIPHRLPEVVEVFPLSQAGDVPLDPTLQVKFNQPMDRASAEANFALVTGEQRQPITGKFEWAEDNAGFSFKPSDLLQLDTLYTARFNPDSVYEQTRTATLRGTLEWSFITVPAPAITGTDPQDGEDNASPYGGFTCISPPRWIRTRSRARSPSTRSPTATLTCIITTMGTACRSLSPSSQAPNTP
jgi:hypothetical protein